MCADLMLGLSSKKLGALYETSLGRFTGVNMVKSRQNSKEFVMIEGRSANEMVHIE